MLVDGCRGIIASPDRQHHRQRTDASDAHEAVGRAVDDAHLALALRAGKGICLIDFSNEVAPALF